MFKKLWSIWQRYWDWRAVYPDGRTTIRLTHAEAKSLVKINGGKIKYDPILVAKA